jgi:hypothetical protein
MATLRATIAAMPPAPLPLWGTYLSRIQHRLDGKSSVEADVDHMIVASFFPASPLVQGPNPYNVEKESKRTWEKGMQAWRHALALQAGVVTVTKRIAFLADPPQHR